jgi:transcriptional regulator with XRE-family HTH domain
MMLKDLKRRRMELKISQGELATQLGVTQGAVAQWESGITQPTIDKLLQLSKLLGCTVEQLLKEA